MSAAPKTKLVHAPVQFTFQVLWNDNRHTLPIREVAERLNITVKQVEAHIEERNFQFILKNDKTEGTSRDGKKVEPRGHKVVVKYSVQGWYLNELEKRDGRIPPYYETPETTWWRNELKKREGGKNA